MKELLSAFAQFQKECPVINKSRNVAFGQTNYSYAELGEIHKVVTPILHKNGLVITQHLDGGNIVTALHHVETGQKIEGAYPLPDLDLRGMNKAQSDGSAITYFRRYAIVTILGLDTEEDTDVQGENTDQPKTKNFEESDDNKLWLNDDTDELEAEIAKLKQGNYSVADVRKTYKVNRKLGEFLKQYENL